MNRVTMEQATTQDENPCDNRGKSAEIQMYGIKENGPATLCTVRRPASLELRRMEAAGIEPAGRIL